MTGTSAFRVDSEVGRLRQVILHRPGTELLRLTPGNKDRLLFDDVLWVHRAQQEHDRFAEVLREQGVTVHLFTDLLRRTLDVPEARRHVLDKIFDERVYGPMAIDALLRIVAADMHHFERVLEQIGAQPFVARTKSVLVLSALLRRPVVPRSDEA